jgi:radical SAM protein with 4Fe4S-binding SPASM domain
LDIVVNSQVNRLNRLQLDGIAEQVLALGCHGWQLQLTVPAGRAADEPDVLLQPYDLLTLFPILSRLHSRLSAAGVKLLPGNNVGYLAPLSSSSARACAARVTPRAARGARCWLDIWERSEALRYTREHLPERLWGFCGTCYYADACRSGCTWTATSLLGRPGNNPYCHHRAGGSERSSESQVAPGKNQIVG